MTDGHAYMILTTAGAMMLMMGCFCLLGLSIMGKMDTSRDRRALWAQKEARLLRRQLISIMEPAAVHVGALNTTMDEDLPKDAPTPETLRASAAPSTQRLADELAKAKFDAMMANEEGGPVYTGPGASDLAR